MTRPFRSHRRVIVESPYRGDVDRNLGYLRACLHDCLIKGEAPFASHGLYTQPGVLNDSIPSERVMGIWAGLSWGDVADAHIFYTDLGWSAGMEIAYVVCLEEGRNFELRSLSGLPKPPPNKFKLSQLDLPLPKGAST